MNSACYQKQPRQANIIGTHELPNLTGAKAVVYDAPAFEYTRERCKKMPQNPELIPFTELTCKSNYAVESLEDEIRADRHCVQLLRRFHRWLLEDRGEEPLSAGRLAGGADYFLRDFVIGARRLNIFDATAAHLKSFGGNWYIISNLEPNMAELEPMLQGATQFYAYCAELKLVEPDRVAPFAAIVDQSEFFRQRIEEFHQLQNNDYREWDQRCPIN